MILGKLERLTLTTRLMVGFGLSMLVILVIWLQLVRGMANVKQEGQVLYERMLPGIVHLKDARATLIQAEDALTDTLIADSSQKGRRPGPVSNKPALNSSPTSMPRWSMSSVRRIANCWKRLSRGSMSISIRAAGSSLTTSGSTQVRGTRRKPTSNCSAA